jgi:hypothetical protein
VRLGRTRRGATSSCNDLYESRPRWLKPPRTSPTPLSLWWQCGGVVQLVDTALCHMIYDRGHDTRLCIANGARRAAQPPPPAWVWRVAHRSDRIQRLRRRARNCSHQPVMQVGLIGPWWHAQRHPRRCKRTHTMRRHVRTPIWVHAYTAPAVAPRVCCSAQRRQHDTACRSGACSGAAVVAQWHRTLTCDLRSLRSQEDLLQTRDEKNGARRSGGQEDHQGVSGPAPKSTSPKVRAPVF